MELLNIVKMYYEEEKSITDIALHFNTYPNKVRRMLISNGYTLRSKSEAQKLALEQNKMPHPTEGKQRTKDELAAISYGVHNTYKNKSSEFKANCKKRAQQRWKQMSKKQRNEFVKKGNTAIREAAKNGSKLENFLKDFLDGNGYYAIQHMKGLVPNTNLEPDLYVESLRTIIEIDGVSHFEPIWGEEQFEKTIAADKEKNGLFLVNGYCVIRIKDIKSEATIFAHQKIADIVLCCLQEIEEKFPPANKRYFELGL